MVKRRKGLKIAVLSEIPRLIAVLSIIVIVLLAIYVFAGNMIDYFDSNLPIW